MRFIESLATWLQQFKPHERETAYTFVRRSLVYIGPGEMQRLVEQFYPRTVQKSSLPHRVGRVRHPASPRAHRRGCSGGDGASAPPDPCFWGLSDGARIDTIRHANAGLLDNEQFVQGTQFDTEKWRDLLENLRKDLNDRDARFRLVYLVDDFAGTGTSFLPLR